ncbi:MAG: SDR family oxidoreductase [Melioribacteraceae bacterium]|nr:SDR family oxidoreductase [Melioribacteraceae bacterium]MCF8352855.1 SDR family oxidoreductase [Melioribacteraceae bacterium]MCF8417372.1 SDR family oxidoreductase [Melioribacteraceae bacterium]
MKKYGEWALITGASSGIGEEFAKRLAKENYNLVLVARRIDRLNSLAEELKNKYKINIKTIQADLSKSNFLESIIPVTEKLDIGMLINNAGFGSTGKFTETNSQHEIDMVHVNCVAPTILTHHFVKEMKLKKRGAVIFLGSVVGYQPTPYMAAYSATKVFNSYLGEALANELKEYNIDVLSINPGSTNTEFHGIANVGKAPFIRTAENVVNTALNSLGRKYSVVDGLMNKIIAISGRLIPRRYLVNITGRITKKLINAS